jgi:hypothetical protein
MLQSFSHSTSRDDCPSFPQVVRPRPRPPLCQIEFPLPQIPGLALNDIRTVPLETRATLLAMLCAEATVAPARAAKAITATFATEVLRCVFIC